MAIHGEGGHARARTGQRGGRGAAFTAARPAPPGGRRGAASQDPFGFDYIRALKLTNFWIRFHLINNIAGGLGTADNLVPASKRDNSTYERTIGADLKATVSSGGSITIR